MTAKIMCRASAGSIARLSGLKSSAAITSIACSYFADIEYGDTRQMLEITDDKFLDEDYDVSVGDGAIVLTSWSDGHTHLYLYSYDKNKPLAADAKLVKQLTSGDFEVGKVYNVDPAHKVVDYASNEGNPLEQQVWQVDFDGDRTAVERRRRLSSSHVCTRWRSVLPTSSQRAYNRRDATLPGALKVRGRRPVPRVLGDARARLLSSATRRSSSK